MSLNETIILIFLLLLLNSFFSIAEFSIASSRKMKLEQMALDNNENAQKVLTLSATPTQFITVIQISLNIIAIVAGIFGDQSFAPLFENFLKDLGISEKIAGILATILSVLSITSIFIVFSELIPKRIAFSNPEVVACRVITPLLKVLKIFKPFVWFLSKCADLILNIFKVSTTRDDSMTFEDMSAVLSQGAKSGLLEAKEHTLIENVLSLTDRAVLSAMTAKNDIIFLDLNDSQEQINNKVLRHPHSRFLVCDTDLDNLLGYIESTQLLKNLLLNNNQPFSREKLNEQGLKPIVILPASLNLLEVLDKFREYNENIATVVNEFGMIVGLITINDVLSTIMGNVVSSEIDGGLIVQRATNSWLIDGKAAIEDVKQLFHWEDIPGQQNFETVSGFLMYLMKSVPKKAQTYTYRSVKFEIVDVDKYRVDEVMATLIDTNT